MSAPWSVIVAASVGRVGRFVNTLLCCCSWQWMKAVWDCSLNISLCYYHWQCVCVCVLCCCSWQWMKAVWDCSLNLSLCYYHWQCVCVCVLCCCSWQWLVIALESSGADSWKGKSLDRIDLSRDILIDTYEDEHVDVCSDCAAVCECRCQCRSCWRCC